MKVILKLVFCCCCFPLSAFKIINFIQLVEHEAKLIYWTTEQKCRKFTKILFRYPFAHLSSFSPSLIGALYHIYFGEYNVESWQLPFLLAVPFDTTVLWGWCLEWLIQVNTAIGYSVTLVSTTSYFVSGCLYVMGICDHFDLLIASVNDEVDRFRKEKNLLELQRISRNIREKLVHALVIHVKALE